MLSEEEIAKAVIRGMQSTVILSTAVLAVEPGDLKLVLAAYEVGRAGTTPEDWMRVVRAVLELHNASKSISIAQQMNVEIGKLLDAGANNLVNKTEGQGGSDDV